MLTKRRFFASALLALVLLSAAACAQIDLAPYEIPNSAMAQITLIQPGFASHSPRQHDERRNRSNLRHSVSNGQPIFSRQFDNDGDWRLFSTFLMSEACYGYVLADHGDPTLGRLFVRPDRQRAVSAAPTDGSSSFRPAYEFRNRLSL